MFIADKEPWGGNKMQCNATWYTIVSLGVYWAAWNDMYNVFKSLKEKIMPILLA